jgi:hypothetical protein
LGVLWGEGGGGGGGGVCGRLPAECRVGRRRTLDRIVEHGIFEYIGYSSWSSFYSRLCSNIPCSTLSSVRRRNTLHEVGGRPQQCDASAESASRQSNTHTLLFFHNSHLSFSYKYNSLSYAHKIILYFIIKKPSKNMLKYSEF